jgi:iron complex outermembrane receptor protein
MRNKILFTVFIMVLSIAAYAQNTLTGVVVDAITNNPLSGATVMHSGKGVTSSDKDGSYSIRCEKGGTITVSFIGYETYKKVIQNCNEVLKIQLVPINKNLDEVEITATSNENKSLLYQPASITKLSPVELKRGTGIFLMDAINGNVPGVQMQSRGVSSGQQFNIRGYGNGNGGARRVSSNFDGQGYKVYLNGIPITDAEGVTTLDDIDFGSVGNVEITKGPAGTLYGLAIAGAVNLHTVKPEKGKISLGQDVMVGNYGLQRYTTHFAMGGDHSSLLVNYGNQKSDGYTQHNASNKKFVNVVGDFQPNAKQNITAYFGYSNSYDQRSGELTVDEFNTGDFTGNLNYIKNDGHSKVTSFRAGLGHTYTFNEHISNTTTIFGTSFSGNFSSAAGVTVKVAQNFGLRSTFDTKFKLNDNINLSGITGVETQKQNATTVGYKTAISPFDTETSSTNPWAVGRPYYIVSSISSNNDAAEATTSVFTEWTLALPKDFLITAGVGVSNMIISIDDRFTPATLTKPSYYDTSYKTMVSPHIAINKVFNKAFSVYASYSKGYKAPVSSNFYITTPTTVPPVTGRVNSDLKPEIGNQFEIGTKGALLNGKLSYELAAFNAVFSNKMTTVAVPYNSTTTAYTYVINGGKQVDNGIEALVKYTAYQSTTGFFKSITPFANLTYSAFNYKDFKYQSVGKTVNTPVKDSIITTDYSNKAVAGVAKIVANIGVDINTNTGFYANVNHFYKDKLPIVSSNIQYTNSYSLLNAKMGFQKNISAHFHVDLFVGVNNITNTKYPLAVFVNQLQNEVLGTGDAYLAGPKNANVYGGFNVKYNF